jgi:hypothetical protein
MGRSPKKVTEESNKDNSTEKEDEISQEIYSKYKGFLASIMANKVHLNSNLAQINPSASATAQEDYLIRFLDLLEENKNELELSMSKKKLFNFNDRRVTQKNKSSEILVRNMLANQPLISTKSLMPDTFFSNLFTCAFLDQEPAFNLIFTLVNDRIYQIFDEFSTRVFKNFDRIKKEMLDPDKMKATLEASNKIEQSEMVKALLDSAPSTLQEAVQFARAVPGLSDINSVDFNKITHDKIFDYTYIVNSIFAIDGEFYSYVTEDTIYTRFWMNKFRSKIVIDKLFEFFALFTPLRLTKKETALLVAQIFTRPGKICFPMVLLGKFKIQLAVVF